MWRPWAEMPLSLPSNPVGRWNPLCVGGHGDNMVILWGLLDGHVMALNNQLPSQTVTPPPHTHSIWAS